MEEPFGVWVAGSKVKVNYGILPVKPRGYDEDYSFCLIAFQLRMYIVGEERRNPIDVGSWGKRSTLGLCLLNIVGTIEAVVFALSFQSSLVRC